MKSRKGFTFIELLIALAVMAICFLPLMRMFTVALEQTREAEDLSVAQGLAREEMERLKNLNFTEAQLESIGDVWQPPLDKPPLILNEKRWRALRKIVKGTSPLEVHILVYEDTQQTGQAVKPTIELVTLIGDLEWVPSE